MNKNGVGLGLVISRKLVGLLGEKENIEVISAEGQGSVFQFEIYANHNFKHLNCMQDEDS